MNATRLLQMSNICRRHYTKHPCRNPIRNKHPNKNHYASCKRGTELIYFHIKYTRLINWNFLQKKQQSQQTTSNKFETKPHKFEPTTGQSLKIKKNILTFWKKYHSDLRNKKNETNSRKETSSVNLPFPFDIELSIWNNSNGVIIFGRSPPKTYLKLVLLSRRGQSK